MGKTITLAVEFLIMVTTTLLRWKIATLFCEIDGYKLKNQYDFMLYKTLRILVMENARILIHHFLTLIFSVRGKIGATSSTS